MPGRVWDGITYQFSNLNGCSVEVWEWIINFIPHFIMDVIIHSWWDLSWTMLVKGAPGVTFQGSDVIFLNGKRNLARRFDISKVQPAAVVHVGWPLPWRHEMETFSTLLALCAGNSPVTAEFPSQMPVTGNFDVFFDLRLNKRLNKQSRRRWFETPSRSSWRHCNARVLPSDQNSWLFEHTEAMHLPYRFD